MACWLAGGLPGRAGAVWRQQVGGHLRHSRVQGQGGQVGCHGNSKGAAHGTLQHFDQGQQAEKRTTWPGLGTAYSGRMVTASRCC
jgi:hypothetical protein